MKNKKFVGIIPARIGSTRLPRKPLLDICGKPMIQHVYEQAKRSLETVYVATDDAEIFDMVIDFGGKAIMTTKYCENGTERCYWAYKKITQIEEFEFPVIINIQGDLPLLVDDHINTIVNTYKSLVINTLATPTMRTILSDENNAYVTFKENQFALYFSRYQIPFPRSAEKLSSVYKHIGIYAYSKEILRRLIMLPASHIDRMEDLEQNRWLFHSKLIYVHEVPHDAISVNTNDDLEQARKSYTIKMNNLTKSESDGKK